MEFYKMLRSVFPALGSFSTGGGGLLMASWPTPPVTEPEPHRNSGIKFYFTALHHTEPEVSEGIGPAA